MNIVLLLQQSLLRFAKNLLNRIEPSVRPLPYANSNSKSFAAIAPKNIAAYAGTATENSNFSLKSPTKTLRVVRVVETGQTRASVGRMVISGRMADVCAELDRLAACEAALT
jgi:hypothetical protein